MPSQFSTAWVTANSSTPLGSQVAPPLRLEAGYDMQSGVVDCTTVIQEQQSLLRRRMVTGSRLHDSASAEVMAGRIAAISKSVIRGKIPPKNGILSPSTDHRSKMHSPRTEGSASNEKSSVTSVVSSDRTRLVCPEIAVNYAGSLVAGRVGQLASRQSTIETRLASLHRRLRKRQLGMVHDHARAQISSVREEGEEAEEMDTSCDSNHQSVDLDGGEGMLLHKDASSSSEISSVIPSPSLDDKSMDSVLTGTSGAGRMATPLSPLPTRGSVASQLQQHMESLGQYVDDEMTDVSSDEEVEEGRGMRCQEAKRSWESSRTALGSRWSWLEHKIAELNNHICQLDNVLQRRSTKEHFTLTPIDPSSTQCVCHISANGTARRNGNGSTVLARGPGVHRVVNGYGSNHRGCTCHQMPQLLLPEGFLGSKLQVKDLLSASLARTFPVLVDEGGYNAARTRPLERKAHRKIVRMRRQQKTHCEEVDNALHPNLSLPEELPSRIWLDSAVKQIAVEHSYASLPVIKRRRGLPVVNDVLRPVNNRFDFSSTPSAIFTTPVDRSSLSKSIRKRSNSLLQDAPHSLPLASPVLSRPSTPTLTPLTARKKKLAYNPSFDIDNIVIPYSMASSTRLEKLEYKEIITPSWRQVDQERPLENGEAEEERRRVRGGRGGQGRNKRKAAMVVVREREFHNHCDLEAEEDVSDAAFSLRHDKCEKVEKNRFLNFISGGGSHKKRLRPQSVTSEGGGVWSPRTPSEKGRRKGLVSPTCSEPDFSAPPQFLPWPPRKFPLGAEDLDALTNPPPPPPKLVLPSTTPSPSHTRSSTPVDSPVALQRHQTPLSSSSTLATPLSSPSTPLLEESPILSPHEWAVVNSMALPPSPASFNPIQPTPPDTRPIILKLSKRM